MNLESIKSIINKVNENTTITKVPKKEYYTKGKDGSIIKDLKLIKLIKGTFYLLGR